MIDSLQGEAGGGTVVQRQGEEETSEEEDREGLKKEEERQVQMSSCLLCSLCFHGRLMVKTSHANTHAHMNAPTENNGHSVNQTSSGRGRICVVISSVRTLCSGCYIFVVHCFSDSTYDILATDQRNV